MKLVKLIIALFALGLLAGCSSTDEHGVVVDKKVPFFGSANAVQTDAIS